MELLLWAFAGGVVGISLGVVLVVLVDRAAARRIR